MKIVCTYCANTRPFNPKAPSSVYRHRTQAGFNCQMPVQNRGKPLYYANDADRKAAKRSQTLESNRRKKQENNRSEKSKSKVEDNHSKNQTVPCGLQSTDWFPVTLEE